MADYGEIICKAVDEIVTSKLQGLQYDITKLCTIVDDSMSHQGKYVVSDGTARYEAFTTDVSFKSGNQVLVTIPNGDYNMQKTIIGRVATTDTTPFNYTPPLDTIIKITNNVFDDARTVYGENAGLLANGAQKLLGPIYSLESNQDLDGYTRLGLSANFKSLLTGLDVASGSYGIKILIYTNIVQKAGAAATSTVYELTFSSADMIGNPYQFEDYFYQEKVFDISNISNIQKLEVYFYQDSNFLDSTGELIPHQTNDSIFGLTDNTNNLFVQDVKMYMGYELGYFTDETLILHTPDSLTYRYDKAEAKEINLRWIHKIDETNYEILNTNNFDDNNYEIHWFKYHPGYEKIDQYAGKDWEEVQDKGFTYYLSPEVKNQNERVKVVGLIKTATDGSIPETAAPYFSNVLIFENEELVPDQTTLKASTALSIRCEDNSEGNYLLYDQNGKLTNEGLGKGYTRYFKAMYLGGEINAETIKNIGTINWIKWYFPNSGDTMLTITDEMCKINGGKITQEDYNYKGTNYIEITRIKPDDAAMPVITQAYSIGNVWNAQKGNNTIICRMSINGVEYEALEELHFGKAGSNGTNTTFFIEFEGNDNALIVGSEAKVSVRARLYLGSDAKASGFPAGTNGNQLSWEWYKTNELIKLETDGSDPTRCSLSLVNKNISLPIANYMILKASYQINNTSPTLEAYLPIPIKTADCVYMEGAREVLYDHQGNPSYYDGAYVAYYTTEGKEEYSEQKDWTLYTDETTQGKLSASYIPKLKSMTSRSGYKALQPSVFYATGYNDKVCASCEKWSQPILIMQSKYDFAMLNEWDGSLTLDDDKGTILSTMLGAGKKNSNNTFSGVLIGDVQGGTGNNSAEALTGVYGLHEGQISYALKEDGTATFGKSGKGQIQIDGNSGTIKSGNYDTSGNGTLINLDSGIINVKNNNETKVYISPNLSGKDESAYLTINGKNNVPLIQVNESKYFLRSHSYGISNGSQGTLLDLNDGTFNISGTAGSIELSGGSGKNLFKITDKDKQTLIEMNDSNYYLKSSTYSGQAIQNINGYFMYRNKNTSIKNGSIFISITDTVGLKNGNVYNYNGGTSFSSAPITFYSTTIDLGSYETENGTVASTYTYSADEYKKWFISFLEPIFTDTTPSGLCIDLNKGSIIGYDLYLRGIKSNKSSQSFTFDSSADEFPILVDNNFKISWDGSLWCNKLTRLANDDNQNCIISIGNNFYVDQNGSAGGSGASWQKSFLGGSFSGAAICSSLTLGGKALACATGNFFMPTSLSLTGYGPGGDTGDGVGVLTGLQFTNITGIDDSEGPTVSGSCSIVVSGKTYQGTCSISIPTKQYLVVDGGNGGVISLSKTLSSIDYVTWTQQ